MSNNGLRQAEMMMLIIGIRCTKANNLLLMTPENSPYRFQKCVKSVIPLPKNLLFIMGNSSKPDSLHHDEVAVNFKCIYEDYK